MPSPDWPSLAGAPRAIPFSTRLGLRVLSLYLQMSCFVACVALVFLGAITQSDVFDSLRFRGALEHASGTVTQVRPSGFSEGGSRHGGDGRPILRFEFEFDSGGQRWNGRSYSSTVRVLRGSACEVEFVPGDPLHARIRGMRSAVFGSDVLFGLVTPLLALVFLVWSQVDATRLLRLIENGSEATGRLVELVPIRGRRRRMTHRAILEYSPASDGPRLARLATRRPKVFQDERGVRLVYDPREPERVRALDDLGVQLGPDELGRIRPLSSWKLALGLCLPALTLAGYIGFAIWLAVR
jgi:hypothetical protein